MCINGGELRHPLQISGTLVLGTVLFESCVIYVLDLLAGAIVVVC